MSNHGSQDIPPVSRGDSFLIHIQGVAVQRHKTALQDVMIVLAQRAKGYGPPKKALA